MSPRVGKEEHSGDHEGEEDEISILVRAGVRTVRAHGVVAAEDGVLLQPDAPEEGQGGGEKHE